MAKNPFLEHFKIYCVLFVFCLNQSLYPPFYQPAVLAYAIVRALEMNPANSQSFVLVQAWPLPSL